MSSEPPSDRDGAAPSFEPLRLLSLREAAAVLGIDAKAVRELVESGEIGAYRTGVSQQPRIPRRALEVWEERIAQGTPRPSGRRRVR
jgi:excisionase family DNA binding protein